MIGKRFSLAGAVLLAAVTAGGLGLSGVAATAAASSHTLKFIAVTTSMSTPTKSGAYYEADVDVVSGSSFAEDVLSCVAGKSSERCDVALADSQGILDAHFFVNFKTGRLSGVVTGGTRAYQGASGTVTGRRVPAGEGVTVVYKT